MRQVSIQTNARSGGDRREVATIRSKPRSQHLSRCASSFGQLGDRATGDPAWRVFTSERSTHTADDMAAAQQPWGGKLREDGWWPSSRMHDVEDRKRDAPLCWTSAHEGIGRASRCLSGMRRWRQAFIVLIVFGTSRASATTSRCREIATMFQTLEVAVHMHNVKIGTWPVADQWERIGRQVPLDPWGSHFVLHVSGDEAWFSSPGADRTPGTKDDVIGRNGTVQGPCGLAGTGCRW